MGRSHLPRLSKSTGRQYTAASGGLGRGAGYMSSGFWTNYKKKNFLVSLSNVELWGLRCGALNFKRHVASHCTPQSQTKLLQPTYCS